MFGGPASAPTSSLFCHVVRWVKYNNTAVVRGNLAREINKSNPNEYNVQPLGWSILQGFSLDSSLFGCWNVTQAGKRFQNFLTSFSTKFSTANRGDIYPVQSSFYATLSVSLVQDKDNTGRFTLRSVKNKQQHGNNKLHQQETWIKKFANILDLKKKKKKVLLSYDCIGTSGFIIPAKGFRTFLKNATHNYDPTCCLHLAQHIH